MNNVFSSANLGEGLARREVALRDHFVDERPHYRRHVGADTVNAPAHEALSNVTIVHGPGNDLAPVGVHPLDELEVNELPVLPQIPSAGVMHWPNRIDGVARLENAHRNLRGDVANAPSDAMVEAMYGASLCCCSNDRDDRFLDALRLDLDKYRSVVRRLAEQLRQGGNRAIGGRDLPQRQQRGGCNRDSRSGFTGARVGCRIMVYNHRAVGSAVDVKLYRVRSGIEGAPE